MRAERKEQSDVNAERKNLRYPISETSFIPTSFAFSHKSATDPSLNPDPNSQPLYLLPVQTASRDIDKFIP
jgi:hypothetical protein